MSNEKNKGSGKGNDRKGRREVYQSFALVMQFGLNMIVPILLCTFFGVWLGNRAGRDYIVIPLFFAGALAGFGNVYRMAKNIYEDKPKPDGRPEEEKGKDVKKVK